MADKNQPQNDNILNNIKLVDSSAGSKASDNLTNLVINNLANERRCSVAIAQVAFCILCQQGATSARASGNLSVTLQEHDDLIRFSTEDIRRACKQADNKITVRKVARSLGSSIYTICKNYNVDGNLAKKLNITDPDSKWASDFQDSNPDCPEHIRNKIVQHFKEISSIKQKKKK